MHLAASQGDVRCLIELTECGGDVNACNKHGQNALYFAIKNRQTRAALWLVRNGIDIDAVTSLGKSALHIALHSVNARSVVFALLARGARVDNLRTCHKTRLAYAPMLAVLGVEWRDGCARAIATRGEEAFYEAMERVTSGVGKHRFRIVRARMLEICLALQYLRFPALVTVCILEAAFLHGDLVPWHLTWNLATAVKHFSDKKE